MTTNAEPKSICIFRLSAIGDATHVVPVIKTIQHQFPHAKITWVIGKLEHKLMKGLSGIEFVVFDKSSGFSGILAFRKQIKQTRFDVLLQMQLSLRANLVSRLIRADRRIGFDKKRSKELHGITINERIPYRHRIHVLEGFMQFASQIGCDSKLMNWDIPVSAEDQALAQKIVDNKKQTVIVSPCSSHELRNWSIENYAKTIDLLVSKFDAQVILVGSPSPKEKAFIAQIEELCDQAVLNVAGQDTLKQLLCLLKQADLVISPDSGPLHMSGSVATPVIGLLAASNYKRSGSYQYPELTVDKYAEACEVFLNKSIDDVKWGTKTEFPGAMDLIKVDDVIERAEQVLTGANYQT